MAMSREALRAYNHNKVLCRAIEQNRDIEATRQRLIDAKNVMSGTGISKTAIAEVDGKIEEYNKIKKAYSNLLEDVWGVTWHAEMIIAKYMEWPDEDIDGLPDWIKE